MLVVSVLMVVRVVKVVVVLVADVVEDVVDQVVVAIVCKVCCTSTIVLYRAQQTSDFSRQAFTSMSSLMKA